MAPGPAGSAPGAEGAGGRDRLAVSAARRLGPRPRARQHRPRRSAPPPQARPRPRHEDPPTTSPPPASARGTRPRTATPSSRPGPSRHAIPAQSRKYSPITTSDFKATPLTTSLRHRLRPEVGPAQNALSWQLRFLGARCPGGGANPARWLRPFGTSKCLSACVPGLFVSRANLLEALPQPSSPRLTLTVPKPLPGTAAQQSWSSLNVLALRLYCGPVQAVCPPCACVRPEAGCRSPQTRRTPDPDCG